MKKTIKKWLDRASHSTLKGGLDEKSIQGNIVNHIRIVLRLVLRDVRPNKMRNQLKFDILKAIGWLILVPSLVMGFWILISIILGIPNDILRASLIWLFIFLLFCLQGFILIIYQHKEEKRNVNDETEN